MKDAAFIYDGIIKPGIAEVKKTSSLLVSGSDAVRLITASAQQTF